MYSNKETFFLQISAGRGPAECCWVVAQVLKVLIKEIKALGLDYEVVHQQKGSQNRTLSSVFIAITGDNAKHLLIHWEGTIQWIGKSPFRKFHKRKNWFVGVSFMEKKKQVSFNQNELDYQTFRASGPGGQHRNKVETAVRLTHRPSGITVTATDSRSQIQNKKEALNKLKKAFSLHETELLREQINEQWNEHLSLERGNAVKVFRGVKFE